ncbi:MAG: hypothetical protein U1D30_03115 [Planctomycetota bacterium]
MAVYWFALVGLGSLLAFVLVAMPQGRNNFLKHFRKPVPVRVLRPGYRQNNDPRQNG